MRFPNAERLGIGFLQQISFGADRATQDAIDERSISATGERDRFVNRGVLWSPEKKQLIEAQPQQISGIVVEMTGAEFADPKIDQDEVAQNAVEKFGGKPSICRGQIAAAQKFAENRVGEPVAVAPLFQGGKSDRA